MAHILANEHPNVTYFKQDNIGLVLSKALAATYQEKPSNPVDFFAKFLLNHSKTQKLAQAEIDRQREVVELKVKNKYFIKAKQAEKEEEETEKSEKERKIKEFYKSIERSVDLADNLDELANFLQTHTGATGVYVGKLVRPTKDIQDDDDDQAHIDKDSPMIIKFIQTSTGHEFMKDKVLLSTQGLSHQVFEDVPVAEPVLDEEGNPVPVVGAPDMTDILNSYRHVFVNEVVREPKMHFYKVPRLGSFMAVPLVYESCQFEEALDNAVADYLQVKAHQEEQNRQIQEWEEENARQREEKEKIGEVFEPENREWEPISHKPFDTFTEKYIVCLDTMGQDRPFTDDEKRLVLNTMKLFREEWEKTECENLTKDLNQKIESMKFDKDFLDNEQQKILDEEEKHVEEMLAQREENNDEEFKELFLKNVRLHFIAKLFYAREDWKKNLLAIRDFTVLKFPRVLQSIMYFLRFDREQLCEKGTNKFFWKIAKNHLNEEFLQRLLNFQALGPKDSHFPRYCTLNFIEKNIEGIAAEEVDQYNLVLGKLYKWLLLVIKLRKDDITRRKALKRKAREERDALIEAKKQRELKRDQDLIDAEEKFKEDHKEEIEAYHKYQEEMANSHDYGNEEEDEDKPAEKPVLPVFQAQEFSAKWEEENPQVVIPPPVEPELDKDWILTEEEEDALIDSYFKQKLDQ